MLSPTHPHNIVLVFGGGDAPTVTDRDRLPESPTTIIAADAGTDHAFACGRHVDVVVGDLDSVSVSGLAGARDAGATIERHEQDKDESDLELALQRALDHRPDRIVVTAISGGRTDHFLANLLLIANAAMRGVLVDVISGDDQFFVVRGRRSFEVEPGQLVTLLPLHGAAGGVTTSGLHYPLDHETLEPGSTRGISNLATAEAVSVEVATGVLVAIVPGGVES